jgi:hypothetical protein
VERAHTSPNAQLVRLSEHGGGGRELLRAHMPGIEAQDQRDSCIKAKGILAMRPGGGRPLRHLENRNKSGIEGILWLLSEQVDQVGWPIAQCNSARRDAAALGIRAGPHGP